MKILLTLLVCFTAAEIAAWIAGYDMTLMAKTITVCAVLDLLLFAKD